MTILEMSLGGALMIAAILVLRRALLHRLPKWTFLLLWAVALCRLLIPFTLPSQFSVFNGAAWVAQAFEKTEKNLDPPSDILEPVWIPDITMQGTFHEDDWTPPAAMAPDTTEKKPVSPVTAIYLTGAFLCGLFFAVAYLWGLRRFHEAELAEQDFIDYWQKEHHTLFPVQIKTCPAINAPLVYGLFRPVVLLPENTDWTDEGQLTFILTHEYIHIRRGDLGWKLLLTVALCLHWFNPLVWAMYFRANQDLELACDEQVVRKLGLNNRKGYAYSLLAAAESGFSPLCLTYTTKNHMEERIRAIMKMKKTSIAAILAAALLVTGVSAVFATSQTPEPKNIDDLPKAVMSDADPKSTAQTPTPTPAVTEPPKTIDRVHPITDTPAQTTEPVVDPVEPVVDPVEPVVDPVAESEVSEPAAVVLENRWNIPADPIPEGTEIFVSSMEEAEEIMEYLAEVRGITDNRDIGISWYVDGTNRISVRAHYDYTNWVKEVQARVPDGVYPVNSKGESYGRTGDGSIVGHSPDLVEVMATNGTYGYMPYNEVRYGDEGTYPVYDVDRNNIIGYFEIGNGRNSDMTQEEQLEMVEKEFKKLGWSETEIAKGLEDYKKSID